MRHRGSTTNCCGGFIGWATNRGTTVTNSLQAGTFNINTEGCYTIARNPDNVSIKNTYYVNQLGGQGPGVNNINKVQLTTGEMITRLQGSQSDPAWAQHIGIDTIPTPFDAKKISGENYVYQEGEQLKAQNFVIKDGTFLPIKISFTAEKATMQRSMNTDKVYTASLPFDWTANSEDKVYTLSTTQEGKNVIYFERVEDKMLLANKPYLVVPGTELSELSATDVTIGTTPSTLEPVNANGVNFNACLAGMDHESVMAAKAYILQADKQWHPVSSENSNVHIAPYRAYLTIDNAQQAKSFSMMLGDGTATDIHNIGLKDADGTVNYYDLSGRYVGTSLEDMPKGVYIKNGKKIVK